MKPLIKPNSPPAPVRTAIAALPSLIILLLSHPAEAVELYVSPAGSDLNSGTITAPFNSLEKARDTVRTMNASMTEEIVVNLRAGSYELSNTLVFSEQDSGSNGHRIIYRAYMDEDVRISGGKRITDWTQVPGKNYYVADVPVSAGYADYFRQLYVNGARAYRASSSWIIGSSFYDDPATAETADGINFPASAIQQYSNPTDVRLLHIHSFKVDEWPVISVKENGTFRAVQCAQPHFQVRVDYGTSYLSPTHSFMIVNAFEELDKPGEWYHNRVTQQVYYYPFADEKMSTAEVYAPAMDSDQLILFEGSTTSNLVRDITLEGITFEHSNWLFPRDCFIGGSQAEALLPAEGKNPDFYYGYEVPGAISLNHTDGIQLIGNTVRHMANCGVHLFNDAHNTLIQGNVFYDTTGAGVEIGRWLNNYLDNDIPEEARCSDNLIDNNIIADTGRDYMQATGISIMPARRTTITHNEIHNCAYMGIHSRMQPYNSYPNPNPTDISQDMGESYIAYNRIGQAAWADIYGVGDNGSLYNYGPSKGTHVFRNYIMNTSSTDAGIYNDNDSYMMTYEENVILKPIWLSNRVVDPDQIYFTNNYGTYAAGGSAIISGYTQLSGTVPNTWPQAARDIADSAGLEPAFSSITNKVPTAPAYDYLNRDSVNLARNISNTSSGWSYLERAYDGLVAAEVQNTGSVAWIEYDLGGSYSNFVFHFTEDNGGSSETTDWKVQRWSDSESAWLDIMPYQPSSTSATQIYQTPAFNATTAIRLYLRNMNDGGTVGFQEFYCESPELGNQVLLQNASFEIDLLDSGGFYAGAPSGWTHNGTGIVGTIGENRASVTDTPYGTAWAHLQYANTMLGQPIGDISLLNQKIDVSYIVTRRANEDTATDHYVKIIAGTSSHYTNGAVLASTLYNTPLSAAGTYNTLELTLIPTGDPGTNSTVWLVVENTLSGQLQIDNVAVSAVIEPPDTSIDGYAIHNGKIILTVSNSVPGYDYRILTTDNLTTPAWSNALMEAGSGSNLTFDLPVDSSNRYFKLDVQHQ